MSEESIEVVEEVVEPTESVQEDVVEEVPVTEPTEETVETEGAEEPDMVSKAMEQNKILKQQLEELKTANTNVFEQNEILKAELEQQQKLVKIAKENEELQLQLSAIKKNSLVENLIASGGLNNDLREWANSMSFEQLQDFAKHAPKVKTILQEENNSDSIETEDIKEWHKNQSKARIL